MKNKSSHCRHQPRRHSGSGPVALGSPRSKDWIPQARSRGARTHHADSLAQDERQRRGQLWRVEPMYRWFQRRPVQGRLRWSRFFFNLFEIKQLKYLNKAWLRCDGMRLRCITRILWRPFLRFNQRRNQTCNTTLRTTNIGTSLLLFPLFFALLLLWLSYTCFALFYPLYRLLLLVD